MTRRYRIKVTTGWTEWVVAKNAFAAAEVLHDLRPTWNPKQDCWMQVEGTEEMVTLSFDPTTLKWRFRDNTQPDVEPAVPAVSRGKIVF